MPIFCAIFWTACSYRLTNLHRVRPNNIKTIFIEGVYDTSGEPMPHEHLWDALQRAFAANGQLRLSTADQADAILRAHVVSGSINKAGERKTTSTKSKRKDPELFYGNQSPPTPGQLRDISLADDYFVKTSWQSAVEVEIIDLRSRKLLLQRLYPISGETFAVRGDQPTEIHHLRHEESFDHSFAEASKNVAERVVADLLIR
jgi:hypothetical protein